MPGFLEGPVFSAQKEYSLQQAGWIHRYYGNYLVHFFANLLLISCLNKWHQMKYTCEIIISSRYTWHFSHAYYCSMSIMIVVLQYMCISCRKPCVSTTIVHYTCCQNSHLWYHMGSQRGAVCGLCWVTFMHIDCKPLTFQTHSLTHSVPLVFTTAMQIEYMINALWMSHKWTVNMNGRAFL